MYDLDMEEGKDVDLTNPIARPRVPHEIMFVVGGWSGGSPTNVIETYDTRADRWITVEHADRGTFSRIMGVDRIFPTGELRSQVLRFCILKEVGPQKVFDFFRLVMVSKLRWV